MKTSRCDESGSDEVSRRRMLAFAASSAAGLAGCRQETNIDSDEDLRTSRVDVPLRIVWVGREADVGQVQRIWQSLEPLPLSITPFVLEDSQMDGQLASTVETAVNAIQKCDIVVAPLFMVADLFATGSISEIVGSEFERGGDLGLLPALRVGAAGYAGRTMAIPIGSDPWALLGNEQVDGLVDVESWNDYDELVAANQGKAAEPTTPGYGGFSFLLRASSAVQQGWLFDRETFAPTIDGPAYVASLELMKRTVQRCKSGPMGPRAIGRAVADGDLQIGIGTVAGNDVETAGLVAVMDPPRGMRIAQSDQSGEDSIAQKTRTVAPVLLPPTTMLGMLSKNCRQTKSAKRWLAWLNSGEGVGDVWRSSEGLGPTSSAQEADDQSSTMVDPGYRDWVQRHYSRSTVRPVMQLIRGANYYETLDTAVRACVHDDEDASAALARVAKQWSELTEAVGAEKQRRAWRRASGREV